jgi:cytochrome b subunit of formate dehydrogenase
MDVVTWGQNPWAQDVLIHASWRLLWLSIGGALAFLAAHAVYVRCRRPRRPAEAVSGAVAPQTPERILRHSLAARIFHWVMAAAMLVLLFTAFVPIVGLKFDWVTTHWAAGIVLGISVVYHVIHASFWLDFRAIWPTREDLADAVVRLRRALGGQVPAPRKPGKYPLENKMYHLIILVSGAAVIGTGSFMMARVETPFWTRNPYLLTDQTWGLVYVLHGLAGIWLVGLVIIHVYFALRPEKLPITSSMVHGTLSREFYLEHHDPQRWPAARDEREPRERERPKVVARQGT